MGESKTRWWLHLLLIGGTITLVAWLADAVTNHVALLIAAAVLTVAGTIRSLQSGVKFGDTWIAILMSFAVVILAIPTVLWGYALIAKGETDGFTQCVNWLRMHV